MVATDSENFPVYEKLPILLAPPTFFCFLFFIYLFFALKLRSPNLVFLSPATPRFCSPYLLSPTLYFFLSAPTSTKFSLTSLVEKKLHSESSPLSHFPSSLSKKPPSISFLLFLISSLKNLVPTIIHLKLSVLAIPSVQRRPSLNHHHGKLMVLCHVSQYAACLENVSPSSCMRCSLGVI